MESKTLKKEALKIIKEFQNIEIEGVKLNCPYFINKGTTIRGGLKVSIGKGTPEEIVEEVKILAKKKRINLTLLNKQELQKFLVDNNLGIDCSGLAYYILDAQAKAKGMGGLKKHLKFPLAKNFLRRILAKFRPTENTNVKTLANDKNSKKIDLKNIKPADFIAILGAGANHNLDHILIVHKVEYENEKPKYIYYTHSLKWQRDADNEHGVRQGKIEILNLNKPLIEQRWIENHFEGKENETLSRLKEAQEFSLRRLKMFIKLKKAEEKKEEIKKPKKKPKILDKK